MYKRQPLDADDSVTVDRRLTGSVRGQWMLAAIGSGGYTAYTRPGSYDAYATLPTDGGSEELPPSVYEQFVARVLESAHAAAESARRAENGAADTAMQAALAQKTADKILADRTDAEASAKRAEAAALREMCIRDRHGCGGGRQGAAHAEFPVCLSLGVKPVVRAQLQ